MKTIWTCLVLSLIFVVGCTAPAIPQPTTPPATPAPTHRPITYAEITPGPHKSVGDLSTVIDVPPFPYAQPLPPPVPSIIDGLYTRTIPFDGTPVPCRRCAGYRLEGGTWSLYLNNGVFKVFQQDTNFQAVGSFAVSNDRITFFNDPYCEEDLTMVGTYSWQKNGDTLTMQTIGDSCSIGLRAKNLTATSWVKKIDPCQPPNKESAITDHWKKPPECDRVLTRTP
ncbi:MAG: hypothetical protein HZB51_31850 [Chloroflexi bacterium]|nr:hypothetical protein [Chloroflexota bacterium]